VNDRFGGLVHSQAERFIGEKSPSKASCFYLWGTSAIK